jgi:hypothetical protein
MGRKQLSKPDQLLSRSGLGPLVGGLVFALVLTSVWFARFPKKTPSEVTISASTPAVTSSQAGIEVQAKVLNDVHLDNASPTLVHLAQRIVTAVNAEPHALRELGKLFLPRSYYINTLFPHLPVSKEIHSPVADFFYDNLLFTSEKTLKKSLFSLKKTPLTFRKIETDPSRMEVAGPFRLHHGIAIHVTDSEQQVQVLGFVQTILETNQGFVVMSFREPARKRAAQ